jgi:hypothetical protein
LDCGCQEGMRDGGTIIVERRLVSMLGGFCVGRARCGSAVCLMRKASQD